MGKKTSNPKLAFGDIPANLTCFGKFQAISDWKDQALSVTIRASW
jgi:hypothetical protein